MLTNIGKNHFRARLSTDCMFFWNYLCIPDITVNDHVVTALDAPDIMRLANSFFALPA